MKRDGGVAVAVVIVSPPMRGRGLKRRAQWIQRTNSGVAPHAGARIETSRPSRCLSGMPVAPHAGARIETDRVP